MVYVVKGGFPRIKIIIHQLDKKHEQGFAKYSIKNMMQMKSKKAIPLQITPNVRESGRIAKEINGIPIDIFTK